MDQIVVKTDLFYPILLLILLYLFILKFFKTRSQAKQPPLPPGPYSWPILGNILHVGDKPHITLTKLSQTYGPLISIRLGNQPLVVGSSPEAATEILKTHDRILSGRFVPHVAVAKSLEHNNLSLGWVFECNNSSKLLLTLCRTELFSGRAIESQASLREKKVVEMVEFIRKMQGNVVNIRQVALATVFNMISNILVSRDLISLEDDSLKEAISGLMRNITDVVAAPNISDFYPILAGLDLQRLRKKSTDLFNKASEIWEPIIKERREVMSGDASSQQDFLDALIKNGSSDLQINMLLLELLSAGTDTSSSTVEWTLAELLKHPECIKKVEEELKKEIDQDVIKESHVPKLTFLQACVKETLRLHPPGPFLLPQRAVESCEVMTYTIPKNCQVLINFWAIGRDPKIWEDPLVYKPERFLDSNLDFKGNDFELIPFGAGRRICPGVPMATKHVPLILASLIHFFDWSLLYGRDPEDLDMTEKLAQTLCIYAEQPLLLIPKAKI
ncbi:LOW QUALITY PROTEIN: probable (S)-N-methylcoclaurine 3'-hydroxylase isozyme 2 [Pistacia vera]|uniref:LOW QUALITY PROTEIN: probable (S)-N-methylcoclaurine 3'-hydroxylase isozyme 2 n=1 Tax=Pistacia vera TaxID=55513 RepID=UPI0012631B91|nr:LOW QUALITY PROTEIN: probable (S)-N-methylcoclaurine 3'-hydroxylase isozyme 2 [Pistacia vera]